MTVAELIEYLKTLPRDHTVIVYSECSGVGCEPGFAPLQIRDVWIPSNRDEVWL